MVTRRAELLFDTVGSLPKVGIADIREDKANGLRTARTEGLGPGIRLIAELLDGIEDPPPGLLGDGYLAVGQSIDYVGNGGARDTGHARHINLGRSLHS